MGYILCKSTKNKYYLPKIRHKVVILHNKKAFASGILIDMNLKFLFNSGKNPKWKYFLKCYCRSLVPNSYYRRRLQKVLEDAKKRDDYDYIQQRADYYCKLTDNKDMQKGSYHAIGDMKMCRQKVYYYDSMEYLRWFDPKLKMSLLPGDINYVPESPQILKSRPIGDNNANSVLLNLNKVRHFIFINDKVPFAEKKNMAIFRGKIGLPERGGCKMQRWHLLKKFWGHPLMDLGEIASGHGDHTEEWLTPKLTIYQQLEYKFVFSIEGNDVASNLKWIMSSNSIAVMPKPTCETWFMEGTLIPNYHYIEVKPDYSDLIDRLNYYTEHTDEAEAIIRHAHEYVEQFRDAEREDIISLLTLKKYLEICND